MPKGRLIAVWLGWPGLRWRSRVPGTASSADRPPTTGAGIAGGSDRMLEDQQVEMLSQRTAGQRF